MPRHGQLHSKSSHRLQHGPASRCFDPSARSLNLMLQRAFVAQRSLVCISMSSQAASLNASASNGKRPASSSAAAGSSSSAKAPKLAPIFAAAARQGGGGTMSQDPWSHELLGRQSSCWHGVWGSPKGSKRVLALDVRHDKFSRKPRVLGMIDKWIHACSSQLDGTVISTKGKSPFAKDELDWKWWNPAVPKKLVKAHQDGFVMFMFSSSVRRRRHFAE